MESRSYETMPKAELARQAAALGLPTHGTRPALAARIVAALDTLAEGNATAVEGDATAVEDDPVTADMVSRTAEPRLPMPADWPEDLPAPDLAVPVPAPPLHPEQVLAPSAGGVMAVHGTGRARLCTVTYRVDGRGRVQGGAMLPAVNVELRDRALERALAAGINARAPRLQSWTADSESSGTAVYSMIIKGG